LVVSVGLFDQVGGRSPLSPLAAMNGQQRWGPTGRKTPARYFCQVCNTWTQGDKLSIKHHLSGFRHLGQVRRAAKEALKKKVDKARHDDETKRELAMLDHIMLGHGGSTNSDDKIKHVALAAHKQDPSHAQGQQRVQVEEINDVEEDPIHFAEDQVLGQYSVNGVVYLEGSMHEDLLSEGRRCEAVKIVTVQEEGLDQEEEVWCSAKVTNAKVVPGSGGLEQYTYDVSLESGEELRGLDSRDIRLIAPKAPPLRDQESTGEWSTVSVKYTVVEPKATSNFSGVSAAGIPPNQSAVKAEPHIKPEDDVLATFNPFGGAYKGFQVAEASISSRAQMNIKEEAELPVAKRQAPPVGTGSTKGLFKRRKKKSTEN